MKSKTKASAGRKRAVCHTPRPTMTRRNLLVAIGLGLVGAAGIGWGAGLFDTPAAEAAKLTVYKSPWCGCCGKWVEHLSDHGFSVSVREIEDLDPIKARYGVGQGLESCHTALVEGYVVEGHVPAASIKKLLAERPKARGLAVPGMPVGAPGMEGTPRDRYSVLIFDEVGATRVFATY